MPGFPCRVFRFESADGSRNMALDEWLLETVAADPTRGALRTYGWTSPTLSLGYFQPIALAESDSRWREAAIVRRPTGGGAIWHDHELTYAIALPTTHPAARRVEVLYRSAHEAIVSAMADLGVAASLRGKSGARVDEGRPFLCFLDRDANDVVIGDAKVVGSAQRRRSGVLLQHGSILLGRSSATPELPGLRELASLDIDLGSWARTVEDGLVNVLGLDPEFEAVPEAGDVPNERLYSSPAWTRKR